MLDGEDFECSNYKVKLLEAATKSIKFGWISAFALGLVWFVMLSSYALGFWYGAKLISDQVL